MLSLPREVKAAYLADFQAVWTFHHLPGSGEFLLDRKASLHFDSKQTETVHAFAGFFKAVLYGSVKMDNIPGRSSSSIPIGCLSLIVPQVRTIRVASGMEYCSL